MKKRHLLKTMLLLFALIAGSTSVCAQEVTTLYLETFGSSASNTPLASYTGYSATASMFTTSGAVNSHYSGSGSVGKNNLSAANLSNGYTNASGLSGCYHVGTANTEATIIQISNIKIDGYKDLFISFGALGSSTSHKVNVSYKIDNGEETSLISNGSLTNSGWTLLSGNISGTGESLTLYFKHTPTKAWTVRLDDIKVTGLPEGSSTTPSISADDVDIAYNATGGSIAYTINSGVDGGTVSAAIKEGNWITLGQGTASPISFTCTANETTTARTATVTLTYTYNTNETVTKDITVTQAAAPEAYSTIPALFAAATSTETSVYVNFDGWVVSGVSTNGKNVFVTDNSGNGFVIYSTSDLSSTYTVGDVLTGAAVNCNLVLFNGSAELKNLDASDLTITAGGTVNPASIDMADLAGVNTGALVSYENLTCSVDGTKYYLTDGTTTLQVYNTLYAFGSLVNGKKYNITGIYQQYNSTKEILPRSADDIVEVTSAEPSIAVSTTAIEATAAETEGTITVTYTAIQSDPEIEWYSDANATTTAEEPSWISADFDANNNVYYLIEANDGEARTAYMKVLALDAETNVISSELITITQAKFVVEYATLPFAFDGGKADIEGTNGLTQEGLGDDYSSSPKLRFDSTNDWMILHFNEAPGKLTFNIKGNGFSGGTFTVQTSEDGVTYTDLKAYTELGTTQSEKFDNLAADVRYIKWIYTEKINGNVALGNIKLAKPDNTPSISVASTSVAVEQEGGNGVIEVTYKNIDTTAGVEIVWYESDGVTALSEKPEWISSAEINTNTQNIDYQIAENTGDERKAYLKVYALDANANDVYSDLITITQAAYEAPFEGATYTLASTITPGKHYIIASAADAEGNAYAMGGQNSNNRAAVAIKVDGDKAQVNSADVREFVISIPEADGLYAIYDETESGYLYAASSDKNYLRTETTLDDNGKWTITFAEGVATIKAQGTNTHCWMQYNSTNTLFACYLEDKPQADVYLYEKDEDKTTVVTISELGYATFGSAEAVDFSETNLTVYTAKVNDTNSEVELTEVSSKQVPAGEAVLLQGEAGTYTGKVIESADRLTDNDLKLATADLTGNGKIYVLNKVDDKVGFYKLSAEGTLSKGKAYLESESAAPFLGFDGEDTTGINSVERGTLSVEGCYTLDGRRVAQPTKGLYIVNGKKVVIK